MKMLEYRIVDAQTYIGTQGSKIERIMGKKGKQFEFIHQSKNIELQLKFITPCVVKQIEAKGFHTEKLQIAFFNQNRLKYCHQLVFDPKTQDTITRDTRCQEIITKAILKFTSSIERKMGLNFILFKGETTEKKHELKNLSEQDEIKKSHHSPMLTGKKVEKSSHIFDLRKKGAKQHTEQRDQQWKEKQGGNFKTSNKRKNEDEDSQLQKALKESQKTFQQDPRNHQPFDNQIHMMEQPLQKCQIKPITADQKKTFSFVNSNWLQAQKKIQNEKKIKHEHKLSRFIKVKHLYNKQIYIQGIFGETKNQLIEKIIQLGGKIIEEPSENCLILAVNSEGQKLINWKKKKGVKILRSQYIDDCYNFDAKLDQKDYFLKL